VLFNGDQFSTGGTVRQVAVHLHVGLPLIATSAFWAAIVGLLGAMIPAVRAARISVTDALRVV
jgi:putative ABC transport system permease protein